MAGIGLAAMARFDPDNELPIDGVVEVLDRLR